MRLADLPARPVPLYSDVVRDRGKNWKVRIRVDGVAAFDSFDRIG